MRESELENMALLSQPNKLVLGLVAVIVVLAILFGIMLGGPLSAISLNTQARYEQQYGWAACPDTASGEILDASQYVTSWSTTGASEKISPNAGVRVAGAVSSTITGVRWRIYLTGNGLTWEEWGGSPVTFPNEFSIVNPQGCVSLAIPQPVVLTGPFTGGIKAVLEVHVIDWKLFDRGFLPLAEDQAYLVPGVGSIDAPAQAQVGDTIQVRTIVGYVHSTLQSSEGWRFWGYSTAQRKIVLGPVTLSDLEQTFTYKIQAADFSVSSGCNTPNRIEWHLLNELYEKDFAFTTTIDVSAFAPSFGFDGFTGDPVSNGSIALKFHYAPNPVTLQPVIRVVIAYGFGGIDNELNLTNGTTSTQIPLGQSGTLHFEGYSVDAACRPSAAGRLDVNVREPGSSGSGLKPNLVVFILVLVAFVALSAVIGIWAMKGTPLPVRILVVVIVIVLGIAIAIFLEPGVLNPATGAIFLWILLRGLIP